MRKENYFILTGAMGAGKTTVINKIKETGILCVDEPARVILKEQRELNGDAVPEKNAEMFSQLMLERMVSQYKNNFDMPDIILFDRGIPDIIAYNNLLNTDETAARIASEEYQYNKHVFIFDGWEEIYTNDDERKVDFKTANDFGMNLKNIYTGLGYKIIEVPNVTSVERALFIIENIKRANGFYPPFK